MPSLSVSVSGVPQPQSPGSTLSASLGQPSKWSGVPSLSESIVNMGDKGRKSSLLAFRL